MFTVISEGINDTVDTNYLSLRTLKLLHTDLAKPD